MSRNTEFIPFAKPSIGPEEEQAVLDVLRSGWLTTGEQTQKLEAEFAEKTGSPHALAVNSATAGLHLALEGVGIGRGDTVLTTPYTFTATAEVIRYLGAEVLFADIDEETLTIDPAEVERICSGGKAPGECTPHNPSRPPAAIIPVHLAGHPCRMEELADTAKVYNTHLVEDAAHAFPVSTDGGFLGTLGTAGVFSFYATKTITTGEGGMITTADDRLAERIRRMRLHGIDREVWDRYTSSSASWSYDVVAAGYKYNMPDIAAALGRVQLSKAEDFLQRRKEIARRYLDAFSELDFLIPPPSSAEHAWHLFILRIKPEALDIDRDSYLEELQQRGIGVSVHFIPLHLMSYYASRYGFTPEDFPVSLRVFRNAVSLPIYPGLTDKEVERVISEVTETGKKHHRRGGFRGADYAC
ncbi:MAG: DegT/DnrJ/EryC1/StrS family aminotransferase [Spirochaetaceae bacterium]